MSMSVPGNSCRTNRCSVSPVQGCVIKLPGECSYYSGTNILGPGINTGDTFNTVVNKLTEYIVAGTVSANNGLSVTSNFVQLGQTVGDVTNPAILLSNREVPTGGFSLLFTGTGRIAINTTTPNSTHKFTSIATGVDRAINATSVDGTVINAASTGAGTAIFGQTTGTGAAAVYGSNQGTSGHGVHAVAGINGGIAFRASGFSTNNSSSIPIIAEFVRHSSGGVAADGIGGTIMFRSQTTSVAEVESGQIRNYFSTALHASRSSAFEFHLVNNTVSARKALIASTGKLTLDAYGIGTFTGTPAYTLQVDSSGNVIEGGLIGVTGANNGLTLTGANVQFGQTLSQSGAPATLLSSREIPMANFSVRFTGTGRIESNMIKITGQNTAGDGFPAGISQYGRTATVSNNGYSYGVQEYSFVTASAGFHGYLGVQSWPYVTGGTPGTLFGKFGGYVNGFSTAPVWDGSIGGAQQLPVMLGFFSALQTQAGGILDAYDVYAAEINSVGGTTQNPAVTNHYALYAEPFVYAANNFGVYINGVQKNYMGGTLGIGQNSPTARLHIAAGTATANTAPLKFTAGTNLTTPENGTMEFDGTNLYITIAGVRRTIQVV